MIERMSNNSRNWWVDDVALINIHVRFPFNMNVNIEVSKEFI